MLREAMALGVKFYRNIYVSHVINHSAEGASTQSYSEVVFYKIPSSPAPSSTPLAPPSTPPASAKPERMTIEAAVVVTACGACIGTSRDTTLRTMDTQGEGVAVKDFLL